MDVRTTTLQAPAPAPREHRPSASPRRDLTGVRITTPRLLLAAPIGADIDVIVEACQDQEIQSWLFVPLPFTRADAERFVRETIPRGLAAGTDAVFAFRLQDGGPLLGMVSITNITSSGTRDGVTAEIGCWSAPWARRRHLTSEAVLAAARWAFGEMGVERLEMLICVGNRASIHGAQQIGFTIEGRLRSRRILRGERVDMWVGSLLPSDLE
ncbi:MAG TPA: GNAT family protein [Actinocrinis sp.]|jgi:RimJ/RimL family protein N-acetyltransferase|uniref:GNAT family N-acetyltransferase n=1 Tax=Actinocrinis sp. TaxID=1920516 RepID=UPI002DDDA620|nr:GNAT family protein [Actinocrinis sp.]HEV3170741.1 GNAT family protein [Actinocrinis sp.]